MGVSLRRGDALPCEVSGIAEKKIGYRNGNVKGRCLRSQQRPHSSTTEDMTCEGPNFRKPSQIRKNSKTERARASDCEVRTPDQTNGLAGQASKESFPIPVNKISNFCFGYIVEMEMSAKDCRPTLAGTLSTLRLLNQKAVGSVQQRETDHY